MKQKEFAMACGGMTMKKYANGGQVGKTERMGKLKEHLFGTGEMTDHDPAEEQMEDDLMGKDEFLSDEGDGEMGNLAEGGMVEPVEESNSKRKARLRTHLSGISLKKA